jgi:endonuclease-3 related protein
MASTESPLLKVYHKLYEAFGPQHWWPADSAFEVVIGAILTQNTSWKNVEKAIGNLKRFPFTTRALCDLENEVLAERIRSAGYFNVKSRRIKALLGFLIDRYGGRLEAMRNVPRDILRGELLSVKGIGPETADCILLYALQKPSFVIDAYTRRIFGRLEVLDDAAPYEDLREIFEEALPTDVALFNEYHALIVTLGKDVCRPKPRCGSCPLAAICPSCNEDLAQKEDLIDGKV